MYYFASDMHLGLTIGDNCSLKREKLLIRWLSEVSRDAKAIFLVGDVFDFWFEYKRVVPKGFTRLLGTLSSLTDQGVEIHLFIGNHDVWAFDYLQAECGVKIHRRDEVMELCGRKVYIAHGDNLGKRNFIQRLLNNAFRNRSAQWLFANFVHPDCALKFGHGWSRSNKTSRPVRHIFRGDSEPLVEYAKQMFAESDIDICVFGHIHCAELLTVGDTGRQIAFLGEWIETPTYGVLSDDGFELNSYIDKE